MHASTLPRPVPDEVPGLRAPSFPRTQSDSAQLAHPVLPPLRATRPSIFAKSSTACLKRLVNFLLDAECFVQSLVLNVWENALKPCSACGANVESFSLKSLVPMPLWFVSESTSRLFRTVTSCHGVGVTGRGLLNPQQALCALGGTAARGWIALRSHTSWLQSLISWSPFCLPNLLPYESWPHGSVWNPLNQPFRNAHLSTVVLSKISSFHTPLLKPLTLTPCYGQTWAIPPSMLKLATVVAFAVHGPSSFFSVRLCLRRQSSRSFDQRTYPTGHNPPALSPDHQPCWRPSCPNLWRCLSLSRPFCRWILHGGSSGPHAVARFVTLRTHGVFHRFDRL